MRYNEINVDLGAKVMCNGKIKAVISDDLKNLLEALEIYDSFEKGHLHCVFCGDVITHKNIDAILPLNNNVEVACMKPECRIKSLNIGE